MSIEGNKDFNISVGLPNLFDQIGEACKPLKNALEQAGTKAQEALSNGAKKVKEYAVKAGTVAKTVASEAAVIATNPERQRDLLGKASNLTQEGWNFVYKNAEAFNNFVMEEGEHVLKAPIPGIPDFKIERIAISEKDSSLKQAAKKVANGLISYHEGVIVTGEKYSRAFGDKVHGLVHGTLFFLPLIGRVLQIKILENGFKFLQNGLALLAGFVTRIVIGVLSQTLHLVPYLLFSATVVGIGAAALFLSTIGTPVLYVGFVTGVLFAIALAVQQVQIYLLNKKIDQLTDTLTQARAQDTQSNEKKLNSIIEGASKDLTTLQQQIQVLHDARASKASQPETEAEIKAEDEIEISKEEPSMFQKINNKKWEILFGIGLAGLLMYGDQVLSSSANPIDSIGAQVASNASNALATVLDVAPIAINTIASVGAQIAEAGTTLATDLFENATSLAI